eukprot:2222068-Rhodomonas_salina.5
MNCLKCLSTVGVQVAAWRRGNDDVAVKYREMGVVSRSHSLSSAPVPRSASISASLLPGSPICAATQITCVGAALFWIAHRN